MTVEVLGVPCTVLVQAVPHHIAHPGEHGDDACERCAIVLHPITWERVLVWQYVTGDYGLSRADENYHHHRATWPKEVS